VERINFTEAKSPLKLARWRVEPSYEGVNMFDWSVKRFWEVGEFIDGKID